MAQNDRGPGQMTSQASAATRSSGLRYKVAEPLFIFSQTILIRVSQIRGRGQGTASRRTASHPGFLSTGVDGQGATSRFRSGFCRPRASIFLLRYFRSPVSEKIDAEGSTPGNKVRRMGATKIGQKVRGVEFEKRGLLDSLGERKHRFCKSLSFNLKG